uniref:Leucine-rich repeat protein SHOC-2 n=1 Tax=Echeneis naucrates TaxID=173247 RepID=A0A665U6A9_ECHNA
MAESVVRALYGKATSLNLNSKKMTDVPKCVCAIEKLSVLLLNNNSIRSLPAELPALRHLAELNLGNNALKEIPAVLGHLESLKKLYLFRNQITAVPPEVIGNSTCYVLTGRLQNLVVLNLNHNQIQRLPPEIKRYIHRSWCCVCSLSNLQHLSVLDNNLEEVPAEIGHLTKLSEINLTSNKLSWLPQQLYQCKDLTKLHVARNQLSSLPEFHLLLLRELYCEGNMLVHCQPLPSVQDAEVLTLKELVARFVLLEDRNRSSLVHRLLPHYPRLTALLARGSCCAICLGPFLTTWLECVHFINLKKDMKMKTSLTIPVRALLCSYKCFSTPGHAYYGVATREIHDH